MRIIVVFLLALVILPVLVFSQSQKTNFAGTWILDQGRS
jgi:hypothetical protein